MKDKSREITYINTEDIRFFGGEYCREYFHVSEKKIKELEASIARVGILEPLIVRSDPTGKTAYELIAGRTRLTAARRNGLTKVPCIIKKLTDSQATLAYGESNRYREDISITEKAYMLKYCLMYGEEESLFAEASDREKRRILRLTYLSRGARYLVDVKKISIEAGAELSYLPAEIQEDVYLHISGSQKTLSPAAIRQMRELYEKEKKPYGLRLTADEIENIVNNHQKKKTACMRLCVSKKLIKRLPPEYHNRKQYEDLIESLLEAFIKGEFLEIRKVE